MSKESSHEPRDFMLGEWQVSPSRNLLSKGAETHSIENKCMALLVLLASRHGEVVSSEEIVTQVWQGRAVGDSPIYKHVATLRGVLGDDPKSPRYIETIARKGYRLIPMQVQRRVERRRSPEPGARSKRAAIVAALALIIVIIGFNWPSTPGPGESVALRAPEGARSLVVIPFENLSGKAEHDALARGIADELLNRLSEVPGIQVIARRSSLYDANPSVDDVTRQLDVQYLLFGSINEGERGFRVSTRLIDRSGKLLWSESFDRTARDLIALQDDVAGKVSQGLALEVGDKRLHQHTRTNDFDAYASYLLGLELKNRRSTNWGPKAIAAFEEAIRLDADFAAPYAGLATTMILVGGDASRAGEFIEEALRLDLYLAEAHEAAGLEHMQSGGLDDYRAAEASLRYALVLNPGLVDAHNWLSIVLNVLGERRESIQILENALQLDPLNPILNLNLGRRYHADGELDRARAQMQKVLHWPDTRAYAWDWVAEIERDAGRYDSALDWLKRAMENGTFHEEDTHWGAGSIATQYARLQMAEKASQWWSAYDVSVGTQWRLSEEFALSVATQNPQRMATAVDEFLAAGGQLSLMPRSQIAMHAIRSGDHARGIELLSPVHAEGWVLRNEAGGSAAMFGTAQYLAVALQRSNQAEKANALLLRTLELQMQWREGRTQLLGAVLAQEAVTYSLLGQSDVALERFAQAVDAGWRKWYQVIDNPCWDNFRGNPRFDALMQRVSNDIAVQREKVRAAEKLKSFDPDF